MALVLSEDETMLVDSVKGVLARSAPVTAFRALRDSGDPKKYSPELWAEMCELGLPGIFLPEDKGGAGFGYAAAGFVAEQMGHVLAASPFLATALSVEALYHAGGREEAIAGLADGSRRIAFAIDERPRHAPQAIETRLRADGDRFVLDGAKRMVADGTDADSFIVVARDDAGLVLVLVPRDAAGVSVVQRDLVDSRDWADLRLEAVNVAASAVLARGDAAKAIVARVLDLGRALLAAELLGMTQEAFDRTIAYLKEREQFGVKIGSFQGLQHRASRLFIAIEVARAVVFKALRALDAGDGSERRLASLAKLYATRTARLMLDEAVQLHGGIGVTDDLDIGLFLKRARVIGDVFGDDSYQKQKLMAA